MSTIAYNSKSNRAGHSGTTFTSIIPFLNQWLKSGNLYPGWPYALTRGLSKIDGIFHKIEVRDPPMKGTKRFAKLLIGNLRTNLIILPGRNGNVLDAQAAGFKECSDNYLKRERRP